MWVTLREAIVNALIHRTYRENQPIQIIRYGNRIEIKNPGFSLKPEEHLGEPGSKNRNPFIAAVFHETNLAETKGSGIRSMRSLMEKANLLPPTFESDHSRNQFTVRLLLHHFLGEEDVKWLSGFEQYKLNEDQKRALIFIKEVGAIDNSSFRQLNSVDTLKASTDLREMRNKDILDQKGKGKATYYVPGIKFNHTQSDADDHKQTSVPTPNQDLKTPPQKLKTPPHELKTPPQELLSNELKVRIMQVGKRVNDPKLIKDLIIEVCKIKAFKASEIASFFNKQEDYFKRKYLTHMIKRKELEYLYPDMINHPEQAYKTAKKPKQ